MNTRKIDILVKDIFDEAYEEALKQEVLKWKKLIKESNNVT